LGATWNRWCGLVETSIDMVREEKLDEVAIAREQAPGTRAGPAASAASGSSELRMRSGRRSGSRYSTREKTACPIARSKLDQRMVDLEVERRHASFEIISIRGRGMDVNLKDMLSVLRAQKKSAR